MIHSTEDTVVWNVAQGERLVEIEVEEVPGQGCGTLPEKFVVTGRIVQPDGSPVEAATVWAVDKGLRSEEALGEATTDADGRYRIEYERAQPTETARPRSTRCPTDAATSSGPKKGSDFAIPNGLEAES